MIFAQNSDKQPPANETVKCKYSRTITKRSEPRLLRSGSANFFTLPNAPASVRLVHLCRYLLSRDREGAVRDALTQLREVQ